MPSAITQAIGNLIKSGNADNEPQTLTTPGQITVIDVYPQLQHLFNKNAQKTLNNKIFNMIHQYNELTDEVETRGKLMSLLYKLKIESVEDKLSYVRKCDVVFFFGSTVDSKDKLPLALDKVINALNKVADLGYTKGTMLPLGVVKLDFLDPCTDKWVVISYVTLTDVGKKYVDQNMPNMLFEEGGIPHNLENQ
jgi:hypothetical protein